MAIKIAPKKSAGGYMVKSLVHYRDRAKRIPPEHDWEAMCAVAGCYAASDLWQGDEGKANFDWSRLWQDYSYIIRASDPGPDYGTQNLDLHESWKLGFRHEREFSCGSQIGALFENRSVVYGTAYGNGVDLYGQPFTISYGGNTTNGYWEMRVWNETNVKHWVRCAADRALFATRRWDLLVAQRTKIVVPYLYDEPLIYSADTGTIADGDLYCYLTSDTGPVQYPGSGFTLELVKPVVGVSTPGPFYQVIGLDYGAVVDNYVPFYSYATGDPLGDWDDDWTTGDNGWYSPDSIARISFNHYREKLVGRRFRITDANDSWYHLDDLAAGVGTAYTGAGDGGIVYEEDALGRWWKDVEPHYLIPDDGEANVNRIYKLTFP